MSVVMGDAFGPWMIVDRGDNSPEWRFLNGDFRNLDIPLISKILVNAKLQRIEYEFLHAVCFLCGKYGHVRDLCPSNESEKCRDEDKEGIKVVIPEKVKSMATLDPFGPRMFVERKSRRNQSSNGNLTAKSQGKNGGGSRFTALSSVQAENSEIRDMVANFSRVNFKKGEFLRNKNWVSSRDNSHFHGSTTSGPTPQKIVGQVTIGKSRENCGSLEADIGLATCLNIGSKIGLDPKSNGNRIVFENNKNAVEDPNFPDFNNAQA
ncbi:hypothetical protein Goarm_013127 [Gossypium armourianum]|uniref:CCHC-type domain-containing protein n=1 Tax=Gossypium armourianum TaxID=34283 RepID=A0A7J9J4V3_9ROSI|nr:hypothetical protein [Gossypium armourianum]